VLITICLNKLFKPPVLKRMGFFTHFFHLPPPLNGAHTSSSAPPFFFMKLRMTKATITPAPRPPKNVPAIAPGVYTAEVFADAVDASAGAAEVGGFEGVAVVGEDDGFSVGEADGLSVGDDEGTAVVGELDGSTVVGDDEGPLIGDDVGEDVVGEEVDTT
jgi:hypothetical protein